VSLFKKISEVFRPKERKAELDESVYQQIVALSEEGNKLSDAGDYRGALVKFRLAWKLLPEPKHKWDAASWLLASIGDMHFFLKDYESCRAAMNEAMLNCSGTTTNPFFHLRLGQCLYELGDVERGLNEMAVAYLSEGDKILSGEDPKYLQALKRVLRPPAIQ
jgi:tetratricopeptide (TPR) repeat protein